VGGKMILLYGKSGSGKTKYFVDKYPIHRILHASTLSELRTSMVSINSSLIEEKPTLINTWFDLDISNILDIQWIDVYVEAHYMETPDLKIMGSGKNKYYWGLKNEKKLQKISPKSLKYFPLKKDNNKENLMELFGTRYNWIKSQFPDLLD